MTGEPTQTAYLRHRAPQCINYHLNIAVAIQLHCQPVANRYESRSI